MSLLWSPNIINKYYVYVYLDPRKSGIYQYGEYKFDYEPFYVGKGHENRYLHHLRDSYLEKNNNNHLKYKIINIKKSEYKIPVINIIKDNLTNKEAIQLEIKLIELIGRKDLHVGILTNMTDEGDGSFNRKHTQKTKRKMKQNNWSKTKPNEFKKHIKNIQKIRQSMIHLLDCQCCACKAHRGEYKGRITYIRTKKIKEKISNALTGKKQSEETIIKRKQQDKNRKRDKLRRYI